MIGIDSDDVKTEDFARHVGVTKAKEYPTNMDIIAIQASFSKLNVRNDENEQANPQSLDDGMETTYIGVFDREFKDKINEMTNSGDGSELKTEIHASNVEKKERESRMKKARFRMNKVIKKLKKRKEKRADEKQRTEQLWLPLEELISQLGSGEASFKKFVLSLLREIAQDLSISNEAVVLMTALIWQIFHVFCGEAVAIVRKKKKRTLHDIEMEAATQKLLSRRRAKVAIHNAKTAVKLDDILD